jgi:hypothetical protein
MRKLCLVAMILLVAPICFAQDGALLVDLEISEELSLGTVTLIDVGNPFYGVSDIDEFFFGDIEGADYIAVFNQEELEIEEQPVYLADQMIFSVYEGNNVSRIELRRVEGSVISRAISTCNNNNICEPCLEADCVLAENSFSCSDCAQSGLDGYCELKEDNICDPDCDGEESDCETCTICFKEGMDPPVFCTLDLGGEVCAQDEKCVGPREQVKTADAENGEKCCVGDYAFCAKEEELSDEDAFYIMSDEEALQIYISDIPVEDIPVETAETNEEMDDDIFGLIWILGIVLVIVILVGIAVLIFIKSAEKTSGKNHVSQLKDQIAAFEKQGYTKQQLRDFLKQQGYDKATIDEVIS